MGLFALKKLFLGQVTPNFVFRAQMGAFEGLYILIKIDGQEVCLPRVQGDPLDDSVDTLIILTNLRAFRELISSIHPY